MSASAAAVDVARSIASYLHPTVAIITGASSGMGKEFARQIDRLNTVDEIWLIARNQQALEDTAASLSTRAVCIPLDLTDPSAIDTMQHKLIDMHPEVLYLINAAGFGKFGDWRHISNNDATNMIELNCRALVSLTRAVLPYMHRGARLLQLASCAAFTPLPHMNIYAATKAFVLSYTRALRWELHGSGITVTAICPAWVKTGFEKVARDSGASHDVAHLLFPQKASTVVSRALLANRLHFAVACCGFKAFGLRIVGKFLPHCITMASWEALRRL